MSDETFKLFESLYEVHKLRGSKLLLLIMKTRDFFVKFVNFCFNLQHDILLYFKELFYLRFEYNFAILEMINVTFNKTSFAYECLMLEAKKFSNLLRMSITEYIRRYDPTFN